MHRVPLLKNSLLILLVLLVSCGFHLRGQVTIPENLKQLRLISQISDPIVQQLKITLQKYGIIVVNAGQKAPSQLTIESLDHNTAFATTSANTNTKQYNITYNLTFSLLSEEKPILSHAVVSSSRTLTVNANRILGSDDEEITLKQEMQQELVQKLLTRVTATLKHT